METNDIIIYTFIVGLFKISKKYDLLNLIYWLTLINNISSLTNSEYNFM